MVGGSGDGGCHQFSQNIWFYGFMVDSGPAMIYKAVEVIWIFCAGGRGGQKSKVI